MLFTVDYFKQVIQKRNLTHEEVIFAMMKGIVKCDLTDAEIVQSLRNAIQAVEESK